MRAVDLVHSASAIPDTRRQQLIDICDQVDLAFFYPVVYRVDIERIPAERRITGGSASSGSVEYLVEDLKEDEFDLLFVDETGDTDLDALRQGDLPPDEALWRLQTRIER